ARDDQRNLCGFQPICAVSVTSRYGLFTETRPGAYRPGCAPGAPCCGARLVPCFSSGLCARAPQTAPGAQPGRKHKRSGACPATEGPGVKPGNNPGNEAGPATKGLGDKPRRKAPA